MIDDISSMEDLSDYFSHGAGSDLLDREAGPGLKHIGNVVFSAGSSSDYWFGQVHLLSPERDPAIDYQEIMGRFGIMLTARSDVTDHTTPPRFRKLIYSFAMTKADWTLMAVREKLSAP